MKFKLAMSIIITFLMPTLVSAAWLFGMASLGVAFVSFQIAVLNFQIQKFYWTESDYYAIAKILPWGKN